jgi:hypothetical protein
MIDFDAITPAALAALPAILHRLIPGGRTIAREYTVLNPTRADRRPGSFKINLRTGRWADFATGDFGGDPVSLCAYVEGSRKLKPRGVSPGPRCRGGPPLSRGGRREAVPG